VRCVTLLGFRSPVCSPNASDAGQFLAMSAGFQTCDSPSQRGSYFTGYSSQIPVDRLFPNRVTGKLPRRFQCFLSRVLELSLTAVRAFVQLSATRQCELASRVTRGRARTGEACPARSDRQTNGFLLRAAASQQFKWSSCRAAKDQQGISRQGKSTLHHEMGSLDKGGFRRER
jgi:hypothetical protein